jgi:hypothetical protein
MANTFRFPSSSKSNVFIREEDQRAGIASTGPEIFEVCERDQVSVGTIYMIVLTCSTGGYTSSQYKDEQNVNLYL